MLNHMGICASLTTLERCSEKLRDRNKKMIDTAKSEKADNSEEPLKDGTSKRAEMKNSLVGKNDSFTRLQMLPSLRLKTYPPSELNTSNFDNAEAKKSLSEPTEAINSPASRKVKLILRSNFKGKRYESCIHSLNFSVRLIKKLAPQSGKSLWLNLQDTIRTFQISIMAFTIRKVRTVTPSRLIQKLGNPPR
ncbi:hypothetical protein TRVA0_027S00870 [Trichomonascus vanleenenianus]|uniref:uncharacterized protein n=1 Tax=Trichomonascus vanleenenianus TaxID=2268995 RepID=UPI003ECA878B